MTFADRFAPREVPRATGVFADRGAESSAFLNAVRSHLAYLDIEGDAPPAARRNVLAYYGVGGFGKSKLSYWLERWLVSGEQPNPGWGKPPSTARPLLTSRVDLERLGRLSVEDFVLTLRATAGASGIPLNSFDVALRAYWQQTHGTEELPAMPVRGTAFSPIERLNLGEQFKESVSEALAEVGVGFALPNLAFRLLTELNRMRQERGRRTRALANPDLEAVLKAIGSDEPSSALPWLVGLMAWDIRQVELPKRPLWVVFVDTYEIVNAPADRRSEAAFQSLVLALPSVLWVVTGQRKLDWATDRHEGVLVRTGPTYWPGLADGAGKEPRQHLIGQLVVEDADAFLRGAIVADGQPVLDAPVRAEIIRRANGWPQHLDFAVTRALDLLGQGVVLAPEHFAASFPALVDRFARDLPGAQREVLAAAALFPRFSEELLAATSLQPITVVRLFCGQPFVSEHESAVFPLTMHESVRTAVLENSEAVGGWTPAERTESARRALDWLDARYSAERDTRQREEYFSLGCAVADRYDVAARWLLPAAARVPSMAGARRSVPSSSGSEHNWVAGLRAMLDCWQDDSSGRPRHERLAEVADQEWVAPEIRLSATRFRGYALRSAGRYDETVEIFQRLVAGREPTNHALHLYQLGISLIRTGRFREGLAAASELESFIPSDSRPVRLRGMVADWHGRFTEASATARSRAEHLAATGQSRVSAENTHAEYRARILAGEDLLEECRSLRVESEEAGVEWQTRAVSSLCALAAAGDPAEFQTELARLREAYVHEAARDGRNDNVRTNLYVPVALHAAVVGDVAQLEASRADCAAHVLWHEVVGFWLSGLRGAAPRTSGIDWLDDEAVVRQRWWDVVERRVERRGGQRVGGR